MSENKINKEDIEKVLGRELTPEDSELIILINQIVENLADMEEWLKKLNDNEMKILLEL